MIEAGVANPAVADRAVADRASDGLVGDDAWLEMAVTCDPEAVEAISEILSRVATGGVSVEPGFRLTDEGLRAVTDPSRPATVRAYRPGWPGPVRLSDLVRIGYLRVDAPPGRQ